ncbi:unnamed protein product [Rangifer tarandus platyrhynchus]|uniref:Family with sequence similarity 187 member B n=1 Tax=Rangifer tarandus platyrhynchus TaxID=3082113 RepID=A0ABN8YJL4_RANTA|nr:unnamed protein product [Rangifer tarandus platyrhynchus]
MLTTLWLLSLFLPVLCAQLLVTCAYKSLCQQALLSGNDVVLQCDHLKASWYFSSFQGEDPFLVSSLPNIKKLPGGSLQLNKPQPSQTGLYRCEDSNTALVVEYEIDFQDVTTLHITHKGLGQNPLQNQSLSLGRQEIIFTHWEPWQDCNRCGVPGERKRLGYCYIQESLESPMPCWLYLGDVRLWSSRLQPEMQVETCHIPCTLIDMKYIIFDNFQLRNKMGSAWLTCPLGSIYRPVFWEANNLSLTWKDQLSGKSISTIMDTSNGGSWLQVFQPATYRCFVQQELTAQFNSQSNVDPLKFLSPGKSEEQPEAKESRREKASSVLKGLSVMMLVGTVLTLLGCLLKQFRFSRSWERNKMLLVK